MTHGCWGYLKSVLHSISDVHDLPNQIAAHICGRERLCVCSTCTFALHVLLNHFTFSLLPDWKHNKKSPIRCSRRLLLNFHIRFSTDRVGWKISNNWSVRGVNTKCHVMKKYSLAAEHSYQDWMLFVGRMVGSVKFCKDVPQKSIYFMGKAVFHLH